MPASSRCTLIDTAWPGHCKRAPEALKAAILPHFHAIGLGTGATEPHACPAYAIFFIYSALLSSPSSPHGLPPEEALLPNVDVMRHMGIHRLARLHLGERLPLPSCHRRSASQIWRFHEQSWFRGPANPRHSAAPFRRAQINRVGIVYPDVPVLLKPICIRISVLSMVYLPAGNLPAAQ